VLGALSDDWTAQDRGQDDEVSNEYRPSSPRAHQSNFQDDNQTQIALLKAVVATHNRLFEQEKDQRRELENEVACLRYQLGEFSFL